MLPYSGHGKQKHRSDTMLLQCELHSWLHISLQDPASPAFLLITFVIRLRTPSAVNVRKGNIVNIQFFIFHTTFNAVVHMRCMNAMQST